MEAWTKGQLELQPWQAIPERMTTLGLTVEDGRAKAWFVAENGNLCGGAEAVNKAMRYCWWAKPFTLLYHLPGSRHLEDWIYQWIANNRYRLPGSTPSCTLPCKIETETE